MLRTILTVRVIEPFRIGYTLPNLRKSVRYNVSVGKLRSISPERGDNRRVYATTALYARDLPLPTPTTHDIMLLLEI